MANPRVHEIANELGIDSKIAMAKLTEMGEFVKSPSSSIAPPVARRLKAALEADGVKPTHTPAPAAKPAAAKPAAAKPAAAPAPGCVAAVIRRSALGRALRVNGALDASELSTFEAVLEEQAERHMDN